MKVSVAEFLTYLGASLILSLVLWASLILSRYEIPNPVWFFQTLKYSFSSPTIFKITLGSLIGGFALGILIIPIFRTGLLVRRKTKGFIRGSDLWSAGQILRRTRSGKSESQITIADIPIPPDLETLHFMIGGSTGTGKSVAISEMLSKIIPRGDRVIITDPNGEFLSRFWIKGDILLNPFDERGQGWSLYNELSGPYDYERFAKSVIPPASTTADAEWHRYAQQLFAETAKQLFIRNQATTENLIEWLTRKPVDELGKLLQSTAAAGLFDPGAAKALASTRFIITSYLAPHQYVRSGEFSLRTWLNNAQGGNLFITWREDMADALRPLISTWLDIISTSILSLPPNPESRIWLIIDELASLEKLNSLEAALTKGRKHGLRVVAGLQSTAQLDRLYGKDEAVVLRSCFRNLLILGGSSSDPDTAEVFSRGLGEWDVERKQSSITRTRQGSNRTQTIQRVKERVVLPSEIMNLPKLTGFLSLAGDYPLAKIELKPRTFPALTVPFEEAKGHA